MSTEEAEHEYGIGLTESPQAGVYDAVILAVAHNEFKAMGSEKTRGYGKPESVVYDLKYVLPHETADLRL